VPIPDGFLISLPFGEGVDWLKNVLAAGRDQGETWEVVDPEVVDRESVQPLLASHVRVLFAVAGIERYLKVKRVSNASSATAG
jgi:hypothetical protein